MKGTKLEPMQVTSEALSRFISDWVCEPDCVPRCKLYAVHEDGAVYAVDNETGDCWTEDFETIQEAIDWLMGKEVE